MSTVGQVIDRIYREWLTPASEQEGLGQLDGAIDDSTTSVTLSTDMISPDEQNHSAPGTVMEVGLEQMLIVTYDPNTKVATVVRGYNGTTAASHSDDDLVIMRPKFARQVVFDAVADEVVSLHPPLWGYSTLTTTGQTEPIEVDADVVGIAEVTWLDINTDPKGGTARIIRNYPPVSSGRAIRLHVPEGKTTYLILKKEFSRPTAESDDLEADILVRPEWEQIVIFGAASRVSSYVDPTKLDFDWATEFDQHQGNPTGTGTVLGRRLQSMRNDLLDRASRRLAKEYPPITTYTDPFYPATLT